nr:unnamed protein product [Callosobruchus analis]
MIGKMCFQHQTIPPQHKCTYGMKNMCIEATDENAESKQISPAVSNEPTNTDLLKIIAQQNEQLLLLQKQVAVLLSRETTTQNRPQVMGEKIVSSTQTEHFHQQMYTPKKRGLSKFSIDMMTSFEVAIRPSQHNKNQFPKIQEITETESTSEPIEPSLRLEGPVNIPEDCPSPEPTVNIEMQDYDSSDEDCASEIGATFYKNLLGQVNNILKKAQYKTKENLIDGKSGRNDKTMHRIKEATLKHLKISVLLLMMMEIHPIELHLILKIAIVLQVK